jgi:hypothetical protein
MRILFKEVASRETFAKLSNFRIGSNEIRSEEVR